MKGVAMCRQKKHTIQDRIHATQLSSVTAKGRRGGTKRNEAFRNFDWQTLESLGWISNEC